MGKQRGKDTLLNRQCTPFSHSISARMLHEGTLSLTKLISTTTFEWRLNATSFVQVKMTKKIKATLTGENVLLQKL